MQNNATDHGLPAELREEFRRILQQVGWSENGSQPRRQAIGVTSCQRGEGVTVVASQLAVTAALSTDRQVLLVDANLGAAGRAPDLRNGSRPGAG